MTDQITARTILDMLRQKHADDVFVAECKTGPSMYADAYSRMDAWVMKKSWAHPLCVAYEIKVSRSDFVQDTKWSTYLAYCNELYFVAPKGIIDPSELPDKGRADGSGG